MTTETNNQVTEASEQETVSIEPVLQENTGSSKLDFKNPESIKAWVLANKKIVIIVAVVLIVLIGGMLESKSGTPKNFVYGEGHYKSYDKVITAFGEALEYNDADELYHTVFSDARYNRVPDDMKTSIELSLAGTKLELGAASLVNGVDLEFRAEAVGEPVTISQEDLDYIQEYYLNNYGDDLTVLEGYKVSTSFYSLGSTPQTGDIYVFCIEKEGWKTFKPSVEKIASQFLNSNAKF